MLKNHQRVLALIPARGGSKGLKNKNIRLLNGLPLIAYTILAARQCPLVDAVVVTTDSPQIAKTARKFGARTPFLRPQELASDHAKTIDAVLHAIEEIKRLGESYDILLLLQPTSPLRDANDINEALTHFQEAEIKSMLSISRSEVSPLLLRTLQPDGTLRQIDSTTKNSTIRRQDMPPIYRVNGAIYLNLISDLNQETSFNDNKIGHIIAQDHAIDIDVLSDLHHAEMILKESASNQKIN